jgi:hypothetical protein
MTTSPRLVVVAHGTASAAGSATTTQLAAAVRAVRPETAVDLCFLDVVAPRLADAIDSRPAVVVPLLLSTGYHVQSDIPDAVARHPGTRVARHLGPHPLLVDALMDRLGPLAADGSVALVGAGSSRPEAAAEIAATGRLLADRLGRPVSVLTLADDVRSALASLPGSQPTCSPRDSSSRPCDAPPQTVRRWPSRLASIRRSWNSCGGATTGWWRSSRRRRPGLESDTITPWPSYAHPG